MALCTVYINMNHNYVLLLGTAGNNYIVVRIVLCSVASSTKKNVLIMLLRITWVVQQQILKLGSISLSMSGLSFAVCFRQIV